MEAYLDFNANLNLNSEMFGTLPGFLNFVKHALSNRNERTQVSAVKLTLRGLFNQFVVKRLDTSNICTPKLSNLTITDPDSFPKVFNVVTLQLENLTASFNTSTMLKSHRALYGEDFKFLQLSTYGLHSLENFNEAVKLNTQTNMNMICLPAATI
ncbi:hypothetical protein OSB04_019794 [Centaurea solstitialis]|uniref:Uncharacterized protein n=1 Tax=Centaurea solstitialis TaxID=347529 RepID=A0AA38WG81_9ASTR|nr:hypothetical protein OSB04_019794 [Centaurea solstitialis]